MPDYTSSSVNPIVHNMPLVGHSHPSCTGWVTMIRIGNDSLDLPVGYSPFLVSAVVILVGSFEGKGVKEEPKGNHYHIPQQSSEDKRVLNAGNDIGIDSTIKRTNDDAIGRSASTTRRGRVYRSKGCIVALLESNEGCLIEADANTGLEDLGDHPITARQYCTFPNTLVIMVTICSHMVCLSPLTEECWKAGEECH